MTNILILYNHAVTIMQIPIYDMGGYNLTVGVLVSFIVVVKFATWMFARITNTKLAKEDEYRTEAFQENDWMTDEYVEYLLYRQKEGEIE